MTLRNLYSFRRNRGLKSKVVNDDHVPCEVFGKKDPLGANLKTPYGQIFKKVFRKDSPPRGFASCV